MKKTVLICLLTSFMLSFVKGEKMVNITGKVIDETSQTPLGYATVTLYDAETKKVFAGEITDESGAFTLRVPTGKYNIKIEYLSFKSFFLENKEVLKDYDMKVIPLKTDE